MKKKKSNFKKKVLSAFFRHYGSEKVSGFFFSVSGEGKCEKKL